MRSEELLLMMIDRLIMYLEELSGDENEFCQGERIAYTECLEYIKGINNSHSPDSGTDNAPA